MADINNITPPPLWQLVPLAFEGTKVEKISGKSTEEEKSNYALNVTKTELADIYKMLPSKIESKDITAKSAHDGSTIGEDMFTDGQFEKILKKTTVPNTVVDVVNDYDWTTSPKEARKNVPRIRLTEKYVYLNNAVASIMYKLKAAGEMTDDVLNIGSNIADTMGSIVQKVTPDTVKSGLKTGAEWMGKNFADINKKLFGSEPSLEDSNKEKEKINKKEETESAIDSLKKQFREWSDKLKKNNVAVKNASTFGASARHYDYLYYCLFTGFEYYLPYFSNEYRQINNTFSGEGGGATGWQFINELMGIGMGIGSTLANLRPTSKGIYIEQPKPFNYPEQGENITIQFPLNNTGTWYDVVQNWQFLYLLLFQNQPGRINKYKIDWPVIYEVEIPNVRFIPFAYIKNIKVEYNGVRRTMNMPFNMLYHTRLKPVIIPEAWNITITLEGLTSEPSNLAVPSELITHQFLNNIIEKRTNKYTGAKEEINYRRNFYGK